MVTRLVGGVVYIYIYSVTGLGWGALTREDREREKQIVVK